MFTSTKYYPLRKNNMHTHSKCNHELKYCEKCDTVYCEKCSKEWKKETYNWTYTSLGTQTLPYPYGNGTVPCTYNCSNHT